MNKSKKLLDMLEMSNLRPKETGLPMVVWIQPELSKSKHGPRIKIQLSHGDKVDPTNFTSITIEDDPKNVGGEFIKVSDFKIIKKFIQLNKEGLLKVWNDEISPLDFANNYMIKV